jgi:hypothetical protein
VRWQTHAQFETSLQTSRDVGVTFHGEFVDSSCQDVAEVTFTSYQAPQYAPNGVDTCDYWDLDYAIARQPGGYYLINSAQPVRGRGWSTC